MSGRTPLQLGEPPPWLDDRALPIIASTGALLFQCHKQSRGPLNVNPTPLGRFNAPAGEYGTTYLSTSAEGAFVETLVQDAPRAHGLLVTDCGTNLLTDARQLGRILDHYGVGLFG